MTKGISLVRWLVVIYVIYITSSVANTFASSTTPISLGASQWTLVEPQYASSPQGIYYPLYQDTNYMTFAIGNGTNIMPSMQSTLQPFGVIVSGVWYSPTNSAYISPSPPLSPTVQSNGASIAFVYPSPIQSYTYPTQLTFPTASGSSTVPYDFAALVMTPTNPGAIAVGFLTPSNSMSTDGTTSMTANGNTYLSYNESSVFISDNALFYYSTQPVSNLTLYNNPPNPFAQGTTAHMTWYNYNQAIGQSGNNNILLMVQNYDSADGSQTLWDAMTLQTIDIPTGYSIGQSSWNALAATQLSNITTSLASLTSTTTSSAAATTNSVTQAAGDTAEASINSGGGGGANSGDDVAPNASIWVKSLGGFAKQGAYTGEHGSKTDLYGGMIGGHRAISDRTTLGAAVSVTRADMKSRSDKAGSKTGIMSYAIVIHGLHNFMDNWFMQAIGVVAKHFIDAKEVQFIRPGVNAFAQSKYNNWSYHTTILGGYNYQVSDNITITPMTGVKYAKSNAISYAETGLGLRNRAIRAKASNAVFGIFGGKIAMTHHMQSDINLLTGIHARAEYGFSKKTSSTSVRIGSAPNLLSVQGPKTPRLVYKLGADLALIKGMMEYKLDYNAYLTKKYVGQQGSVGIRVNF